jgi:TonB family protein
MKNKWFVQALIFHLVIAMAKGQSEAQMVRKGDYFGFQNAKGEWLIEPKYALFDGPYSDFMIAQNDQKLRGAINRKGDTLVAFEYQMIQKAKGTDVDNDGKRIAFDALLVQKDQKYGLIDPKGLELLPIEFELGAWVNDSTVFFSRPGRQMALNPLGQIIFETDFDKAELLNDAFGKCRLFRVFKNKMGWSVADFSGKPILPFAFADIRLGGPSGKTLIVTNNDLLVGLHDLNGNELVQPRFKWIRLLNDRLFIAPQADGPLLGLFDLSGRQRMPFEYTDIESVGHSGRLKARKKGTQFGLFDAEGSELTFMEFTDFVTYDLLPTIIFAQETEGKWELLNLEGRYLHFPPLDKYYGPTQLGFAGNNGGLSAFFLANGQRITPFQYAYVNIFHQKDETRKYEKLHSLSPATWFIGWVKIDGEMRLIDNVGKEWPVDPAHIHSLEKEIKREESGMAKSYPPPPLPSDNPHPDEEIYGSPNQPAEFPGGESMYIKFVLSELKYPTDARENKIEGTVFAKFVVEKDGSITNIELENDIGGGCGEEVIRIIELMPKWKPAKKNGQTVRSWLTLPVKFKMEG